jgi:hypothetical protein
MRATCRFRRLILQRPLTVAFRPAPPRALSPQRSPRHHGRRQRLVHEYPHRRIPRPDRTQPRTRTTVDPDPGLSIPVTTAQSAGAPPDGRSGTPYRHDRVALSFFTAEDDAGGHAASMHRLHGVGTASYWLLRRNTTRIPRTPIAVRKPPTGTSQPAQAGSSPRPPLTMLIAAGGTTISGVKWTQSRDQHVTQNTGAGCAGLEHSPVGRLPRAREVSGGRQRRADRCLAPSCRAARMTATEGRRTLAVRATA